MVVVRHEVLLGEQNGGMCLDYIQTDIGDYLIIYGRMGDEKEGLLGMTQVSYSVVPICLKWAKLG